MHLGQKFGVTNVVPVQQKTLLRRNAASAVFFETWLSVNSALGLRVTVQFTFHLYHQPGQLPFVPQSMALQAHNLISDLEHAVATRSAETGRMLRRVTDLFLISAGDYTAEQLELYDGILQVLIAAVEVSARAELSQRLAAVDGAPVKTIRTLALDDAIEVAEPVLSRSRLLDDETLTHCITIKGQEHLLAIARRSGLSSTVSDQLVTKGDTKVLRTLVSNPGAAISDFGFRILVKKSSGDDWLSERVARRVDIPEHHLHDLISKASTVVRNRLLADRPELSETINEILPSNAPVAAGEAAGSVRDYRTAELVVKSRPITEAAVNDFAKAKKLEEIIVAISLLSGLSTSEIERLFMGVWSSPVSIILKAVGFHITTLEAIYRARLPKGDVVRDDLSQIKAEFISLRRPTAERILRFYSATKAVKSSQFS
jgi:hypothetical protein